MMKKIIFIIVFILISCFFTACNKNCKVEFVYENAVVHSKIVSKGEKTIFYEYETEDYISYEWYCDGEIWDFDNDIVNNDVTLTPNMVFKGGVENRIKYIDIEDSLYLNLFEKYEDNYNGKYRWESSDPSIISVTNDETYSFYEAGGKIFGRKLGTAEIRLYYEEKLVDKLTISVISYEETFKNIFGEDFKVLRAIIDDYKLPSINDVNMKWSIEENVYLSIEEIDEEYYVVLNKDKEKSKKDPWTDTYTITLMYDYNGQYLTKDFYISARFHQIDIVSINEAKSYGTDEPYAVLVTIYEKEGDGLMSWPIYYGVDKDGTIVTFRPFDRDERFFKVGDIVLIEYNVETINERIRGRIVYYDIDKDFDQSSVTGK